jgi:hypothetical protein
MLPYFANALPIKFKGKSIKCCKLLPLVITAIVMVVFGLITPYGFKGLSFIFTTSIGNKVNSSISELKPITVTFNYTNVFLLAFIAMLLCLYMFNKKGKTNLRYVLLTIGTALMALMYKKLFAYFIIASYPVALAFVENINFKSFMTFSNKKRKSNKRILIVATEFVLILLVGLCGFTVYDFAKDVANSIDNNGGTVHTANLDDALDAIEADSKSTGTDIVLYNGFNDGGYIEFKGYKAYIDPRADSFVEEANHDYDYLNEYFDFSGGDVYYQDIVDKYGFTYLIVEKKTDKPLYISLLNDDNYQLIFDLDDEETKESIHVFKYTK